MTRSEVRTADATKIARCRSACAAAPASSVTTESVREHLDGKIARYKIPRKVVVIDELPRTASGKVRKADLRSRYGG